MSTVAVSRMPTRGLLRILGLAFGVATVVGGVVGVGILRTTGTIDGLLESPRVIYVVWLVGGVYALLAVNTYAELAFALVTVISVFADLLCALALFVLRRREPHLPRPYRAFGYPWVPGIVRVTCTALLIACIFANPRPSLVAVAVIAAAVPLFRYVCPARARAGGEELAAPSTRR